jgi:hypothetical protein
MNPTRVLFVYRSRRNPVRFETAWIEDRHDYPPCDWDLIEIIEPDRWIEYLLNTKPEGRNDHIATLSNL